MSDPASLPRRDAAGDTPRLRAGGGKSALTHGPRACSRCGFRVLDALLMFAVIAAIALALSGVLERGPELPGTRWPRSTAGR